MEDSDLLTQSINLFKIADVEKIENVKMTQEQKESYFNKLTGKFLVDSLHGKWENKDEHFISSSLSLKQIKNFPKIIELSNKEILNLLITNLKDISIINIGVFLKEIISKLNQEINTFTRNLPNPNQLDNQKLSFKNSFLGCSSHCKLCGRKCDETHTPTITKHKCSTGHQFKVFGGSKYQDDSPSFISCNSMKDETEIIFEGKEINWREFKQNQPDWDYSSEELEKFIILEKNKQIWDIIGTSVCDYYTKKRNKINYSEWKDDTKFVPRIHLILLLDDSGSMSNDNKWYHLIEAVKNTFNLILGNNTLKNNIKVTVFIHESTTKNCFTKEQVDLSLINLIQPRWGCNDFEPALAAGYDAILDSQNEFDSFRVAFMSDGGCSYPKNIIEKINKDDKKIKSKIQFNCIMFGTEPSGIEVNKKIAANLGGKYTNAITFEDLKNSFKEVLNQGFI